MAIQPLRRHRASRQLAWNPGHKGAKTRRVGVAWASPTTIQMPTLQLCALSLWTRSIWLGVLIHVSVADAKDLSALSYRNQLGQLLGM